MRGKSMKISYDALEEIAEDFYNYEHTLSEFRCFGYDDGSSIVEINELGKIPKRLKITVLVEEFINE